MQRYLNDHFLSLIWSFLRKSFWPRQIFLIWVGPPKKKLFVDNSGASKRDDLTIGSDLVGRKRKC